MNYKNFIKLYFQSMLNNIVTCQKILIVFLPWICYVGLGSPNISIGLAVVFMCWPFIFYAYLFRDELFQNK